MLDVITIGSATVDVFASVDRKFSEVKKGDKVLVEGIKFEVGGGGVNSAIGLSRMGLRVGCLCKLGHDFHAFKIIHELKKEKVRLLTKKPSKKATSYSFIELSNKENDRIIYTYKGASDDLEFKEIKGLNTRWVYMATMLGESFRTCKKLADYCEKRRIKIMFNPSSYLAAKGKEYLKKILKAAEILVLNKSEAKLLLKTKNDDIKFILKTLYDLGPSMVVITEGRKGVYVYDREDIYFIKPHNVKVVNSAGAGDAFASGFLAGMIEHNDVMIALNMGLNNAESVIKYHGARNKLLNYKEANKTKTKVIVK